MNRPSHWTRQFAIDMHHDCVFDMVLRGDNAAHEAEFWAQQAERLANVACDLDDVVLFA